METLSTPVTGDTADLTTLLNAANWEAGYLFQLCTACAASEWSDEDIDAALSTLEVR